MRIYRMIATFGKLEQQTLTLEPGLNIITAPNEWGKSTWCAFLVAMLYGLDTRSKTTRTALADKERYAPWSGSPMAGRIDLCWQGRDITIERSTRRRVPLGEFRAYETQSGLAVEELTAANCGQMLLGVEQEVFRRAGFIRHSDLPVTQDEALRRRLNDLVTTADESGAADRLASSLKELKNRCRYNRTGLLPQAEAQREELEEKLRELRNLQLQSKKLQAQLEELTLWQQRLENHQLALDYAHSTQDAARVAKAQILADEKAQALAAMEQQLAPLPQREETRQKLDQLQTFRQQWNEVRQELLDLPPKPDIPDMPAPFTGMTLDAAYSMVKRDTKLYKDLSRSGLAIAMLLMGILGTAAGGLLLYLGTRMFAAGAGITGLAALIWAIWETAASKGRKKALVKKYGNPAPQRWIQPVQEYEAMIQSCRASLQKHTQRSEELEIRLAALRKEGKDLCGDENPEALIRRHQETLDQLDALEALRREAETARLHWDSLRAMLRTPQKPPLTDDIQYTAPETARALEECTAEQQRLQNRMGQYQGRMANLGTQESIQQQLAQVDRRIGKLEDTYAALLIAQEALADARAELQRRFAPRITRQAQAFLSRMTDGRYHTLTMGEDLSLRAGADREETLHDALWRSDGTIDQLYLALRLAVAQELTPQAPLVLDDALVRFDDDRLAQTMAILKELAASKQVICFTCQGREAEI